MSASEPIDLAADNALLRAAVASLTEAKDQLQAQVVTLTEKLEVLLARVAQMSRRMYAHTTERHDPNQQTIFGDPQAAPDSTAARLLAITMKYGSFVDDPGKRLWLVLAMPVFKKILLETNSVFSSST